MRRLLVALFCTAAFPFSARCDEPASSTERPGRHIPTRIFLRGTHESLEESRDPKRIPELIRDLRHKNAATRGEAARELDRFGTEAKSAIPLLLRMLEDDATFGPKELADFPKRDAESDSDASSELAKILTHPVSTFAVQCLVSIGSEAVASVIAALDDASPDVRERAIYILKEIGPRARSAIPKLLGLVDADDPAFQADVVWAVRRIDRHGAFAIPVLEKRLLPTLLQRLHDPNGDVRSDAAMALGDFCSLFDQVVPALLERLHDESPFVRGHAAESLGNLGKSPETVVPALVDVLKSRDRSVELFKSGLRIRGNDYCLALKHDVELSALAKFGEQAKAAGPDLVRLISGYDDSRLVAECASTLASLGPGAKPLLPEMIELLKRPKMESLRRTKLIGVIEHLGHDAGPATASLRNLMKDPRPVRLGGFMGLLYTFLSDAPSDHPVNEIDSDVDVQVAVARALVSIDVKRNPTAWRRLMDEIDNYAAGPGSVDPAQALKDAEKAIEDAENADQALKVDAWGRHASALLSLYVDNGGYDHNVGAIVETLGRIGPDAAPAVPRLVGLLESARDSSIGSDSNLIVVALGRIGPGAKAAIPLLIKRLVEWRFDFGTPETEEMTDWNRSFGNEEMQTLLSIGPSSIAPLVKALEDARAKESVLVGLLATLEKFGPQATDALPAVVRYSRDARRDVRAAAARALGRIHSAPEIAVPELLRLIADQRPRVREQAALSLAAFKGESNRTVPGLMAALKDEYIDVRAAAAESLGEIGPPARMAAPALEQVLDDPNPLVRLAAEAGLAKVNR